MAGARGVQNLRSTSLHRNFKGHAIEFMKALDLVIHDKTDAFLLHKLIWGLKSFF